MRRFLCGVPKDSCCGAGTGTNGALGKFIKMHGSSQEAFNCYAQYLIKLGYTQIGSREFAAPNNGPITVLTRKGKFGAPMRMGKNLEGKGNRYIPKKGKRAAGGVII